EGDGATADADPARDTGTTPDTGTGPVDAGFVEDVGAPVDLGPARSCGSDRDCTAFNLVCDRAAGRCVDCVADTDCLDGRFCSAAQVCTPRVCSPGASTCVSTSRQSACDARGGALVESACASGETCRAGRCQPSACTPGVATCDTATGQRRVCNPDGGGTTLEPCGPEQRCSGGTCVSLACSPGSRVCQGQTSVLVCNGTGTSTSTSTCPTRANAERRCTDGACGFSCGAGFADCNGVASDGCETSVATNTNCGACGLACGGGQNCLDGRCQTVAAGANFRVNTLGTTACAAVTHKSSSGDDRGGIAVSSDAVYYNGDSSTVRASATDLSGLSPLGVIHDGIFNDVATAEVYALLNAAGTQPVPTGDAFTITQLGRISAAGALGTARIPLSMPITVSTGGDAGVFSGYGQLVLYSGALPSSSLGNWYAISLPGGVVRPFGAFALPAHQGCENWASWGIAESVGGVITVLLVETATAVIRFNPTDQSIARLPFTNLSDMCSIGFSTSRNRWYFHAEYASQFSTLGEMVGYCSASWSSP
ncbi:MAG: hypothetical protein JWM10_2032, partial [Myxococcaceae bacterium]|nr:hypothetical protein [Myxococcaceae bacterium]